MIPSATYVFADAQTHINLYMHTPVLNQIRGLFNYSLNYACSALVRKDVHLMGGKTRNACRSHTGTHALAH